MLLGGLCALRYGERCCRLAPVRVRSIGVIMGAASVLARTLQEGASGGLPRALQKSEPLGPDRSFDNRACGDV